MPVLMELNKIIIREGHDTQIIVLHEVDGERHFPIVIGNSEAMAIDRRLKGYAHPRPLTHDLLAAVIDALGGKLERIAITRLEHQTFYARLFVRQGDKVVEVDSRPSDAIALGIASTVPIYVAAEVLDEVGS